MRRKSTLNLMYGFLSAGLLATGCGESSAVKEPPSIAPLAASQKVDENPDSTDDSSQQSTLPMHCYFHKEEQPHAAEWGYQGEAGPEHWGDLSPEYRLAKTGRHQSPIDISQARSESLPKIQFAYGPSQIDLIYNGHTVEEVENHESSITVDGKRFVLQQFHFHSPSEHTIDGQHSAMEMHFVHKSDDGEIAVVGVLIEEGADNAAFDQVWNYLPSAENRERKESVTIDAATLLPTDKNYYRYTGSFTTPPCTENVLWMILESPVELSARQITTFRDIIDGNNRPVQAINDRVVAESAR
ncbi:MAG: carbonic anhydrase [Planctomycetaceae bacterium]|jgi:carbonic anhydrase